MTRIQTVDRLPKPVWQDINLNILSLHGGATAPDTFTIPGTSLLISSFIGNATTQDCNGSLEILHDYLEGSEIHAHLHWCPTTTNPGNVKWNLEYAWININTAITTSTTLSVVQASTQIVGEHQTAVFPFISGNNMLIGSRFVFRLFRNPTDVLDTYPDHAGAFDFGIHYQLDALGSHTVTVK